MAKSGAKVVEAAPDQREMTEEEKSKDAFFIQLARLTEAMIDKHGKEFATGTLILSARFIAEGKALTAQKN